MKCFQLTEADNYSDEQLWGKVTLLSRRESTMHFDCPSKFAVKFSDSDLFYGNRRKKPVISRTIKASLHDKTVTAKLKF